MTSEAFLTLFEQNKQLLWDSCWWFQIWNFIVSLVNSFMQVHDITIFKNVCFHNSHGDDNGIVFKNMLFGTSFRKFAYSGPQNVLCYWPNRGSLRYLMSTVSVKTLGETPFYPILKPFLITQYNCMAIGLCSALQINQWWQRSCTAYGWKAHQSPTLRTSSVKTLGETV